MLRLCDADWKSTQRGAPQVHGGDVACYVSTSAAKRVVPVPF